VQPRAQIAVVHGVVHAAYARRNGKEHRADGVVEVERHALTFFLDRGRGATLSLRGHVKRLRGAFGHGFNDLCRAVAEGRAGARAAHEHALDRAVILNRRADDAVHALGDDRAIVVVRDIARGEVLVDAKRPSEREDLAA